MSSLTKTEKDRKIRLGEPIELFGLTFYPITMANYETFLETKNAMTLRMSTLPLKYIFTDFLSALWAMEYDYVIEKNVSTGLFDRVLNYLYLSLRLEYDRKETLKTIYTDSKDFRVLRKIVVTQDGKTVDISPKDFSSQIRALILEQNGLEVPDESYNPELIQAEMDLAQKGNSQIKFDINTMISSVAYASHVEEKQVQDWTILQFESRKKAIERDKNYMLYTQAELAGMVKFPKGNPCPSWLFDKEEEISSALKPLSDVKQNFAAFGDLESAVGQPQKNQ